MYDTGISQKELDYCRKYKESPEIRIAKFNNLLSGICGKKVLNLGCGTGDMFDPQFHDDNIVIGLDISTVNLGQAKISGHIPTCCDIEQGLPFKNKSFDVIIANELVEHIVNTDFLLFEINRVLKDNGLFMLSTPNVNAPLSFAMMMLFDMPPFRSARYKSQHVRDFTKRTITMALANNGFSVQAIYGNALFIPYLGYFLKSVCNILPRLGDDFIIRAIKTRDLEAPDPGLRWYLEY
jgi:2-polyprenyl-3-methyl-5-hydroxy-6-metoxy-1,4-benzoquinol methylase